MTPLAFKTFPVSAGTTNADLNSVTYLILFGSPKDQNLVTVHSETIVKDISSICSAETALFCLLNVRGVMIKSCLPGFIMTNNTDLFITTES